MQATARLIIVIGSYQCNSLTTHHHIPLRLLQYGTQQSSMKLGQLNTAFSPASSQYWIKIAIEH